MNQIWGLRYHCLTCRYGVKFRLGRIVVENSVYMDFHSDKMICSCQKVEANTPLFSNPSEVYFSTMIIWKGADMWILLTKTWDRIQHSHFQSYFCYFITFWCQKLFLYLCWLRKGGVLGAIPVILDHCSHSVSQQCPCAARKYCGENQDAVALALHFQSKWKSRGVAENIPVPGVDCSPETHSVI